MRHESHTSMSHDALNRLVPRRTRLCASLPVTSGMTPAIKCRDALTWFPRDRCVPEDVVESFLFLSRLREVIAIGRGNSTGLGGSERISAVAKSRPLDLDTPLAVRNSSLAALLATLAFNLLP